MEFATNGGQASWWLNAMAERAHRERDSKPCERPSDHREAGRVAILTWFDAPHPEIIRQNIGLAEPSAGAALVCTLTDREAERGGCG